MTPQLAAALTTLAVALVTGLTTWRVTRFLLLDSLLEPIRKPFERWLAREGAPVVPDEDEDEEPPPPKRRRRDRVARYLAKASAAVGRWFKRGRRRRAFVDWLGRVRRAAIRWLGKLYTCAFCVSVWVSAGANLLWVLAVGGLGWLFVFTWLGAATIAMIVYRYVDPPDPCLATRMCGEG